MSTCADPEQEEIRKAIRCEPKLNCIIIAACSPRMNRPSFRCAVFRTGFNPFIYEMANTREFNSSCHPSECGPFSNWRHFQAMLKLTASQKRTEAVERRMIMIIEDVVE